MERRASFPPGARTAAFDRRGHVWCRGPGAAPPAGPVAAQRRDESMAGFLEARPAPLHDSGIQARRDAWAVRAPSAAGPFDRTAGAVRAGAAAATGVAGAAVPERFAASFSALHAGEI